MSKVLISHEIPKQLFPQSRWINDYPYILGHLLWKEGGHYDEDYASFYKEQIKKHKFSILDNSGFELGSSIPNEVLHQLGEEYQPSHIVLPDVAFDREETLKRTYEYLEKYTWNSTPKFIACIQGQGILDLLEMYELYVKIQAIDLVAVSCCVVDRDNEDRTARAGYIDELIIENRGYLPKKLHLLGCKHPNEFMQYTDYHKKFIHSIDTSAPIIYGWNNVEFPYDGLDLNIQKPTEKLADNLDKSLLGVQVDTIAKNVRSFASYVNRLK